jgi:uncharacterized glyoxalase superfamily protein PhnB
MMLGASERMRMAGPDGRVGHAGLDIGDSTLLGCRSLGHRLDVFARIATY